MSKFWGLSVIVASLVAMSTVSCGAKAASAKAAEKAADKSKATPAKQKADKKSGEPVSAYGDWYALGSGCKARKSAPGNVSFEGLASPGAPNVVRGQFRLNDYKLESPPENAKTSMTFARECSLRIGINPPEGKRIKSASARTKIVFSKAAKVNLQIQGLLYLGGDIVGKNYEEFPSGDVISNREQEVVVVSGKSTDSPGTETPVNEIPCGQSSLFGYDFTFIAGRNEKSDSALIKLAGDKLLEFAVELEPCQK